MIFSSNKIVLICIILLFGAIRCARQMAGPATEEGNPQIAAIVVDSADQRVSGAQVAIYLIPAGFDSLTEMQAPSAAVKTAVSWTDGQGRCGFFNLVPGQYVIEAKNTISGYSSISRNISISGPGQATKSDTLTLKAPGGIRGTVTRNGVLPTIGNAYLKDGFIQVKLRELDRFTITGPDGVYAFDSLPQGLYTMLYYSADGFYSTSRGNIRVVPDSLIVVDTVILKAVPRLNPPGGFFIGYDTVEGVVDLGWNASTFAQLRYYEIERIDTAGTYGRVWHTTDTLTTDTIRSIPVGTTLYYVVRCIDMAFNSSANAGPFQLTKHQIQ